MEEQPPKMAPAGGGLTNLLIAFGASVLSDCSSAENSKLKSTYGECTFHPNSSSQHSQLMRGQYAFRVKRVNQIPYSSGIR